MTTNTLNCFAAIGWLTLVLATCSGCGQQTPVAPVETGSAANRLDERPAVALKVLVVGADGLGELIQQTWNSEAESELSVVSQTLENFAAQDYKLSPEIDVVVYPGTIQTDLVVRDQLLEIPAENWNSSEIGKAELLHFYRSNLVSYGNTHFAAPLGGQQLCLLYRQDVLAALGVNPPQTWTELAGLAEQLKAQAGLVNPAGEPLPTQIALPWAGDWPAHLLLAMSASSVRSPGKLSTVFNVDTMGPLLDRIPFVEALDQLGQLRIASPVTAEPGTPADAYREILAGRAAIAITWPSQHFARDATPHTSHIRIANLPGSNRYFDFTTDQWNNREDQQVVSVAYLGIDQFVVSAARNSLHAGDALALVGWLASKRTSGQLAEVSPWIGPFRTSQLADPQSWTGEGVTFETADAFAEVIRQAHESKMALVFPRVEEQSQLLGELSAGIREWGSDGKTAAEVLAAVSQKWTKRLQARGLMDQRRWLRKGEGL